MGGDVCQLEHNNDVTLILSRPFFFFNYTSSMSLSAVGRCLLNIETAAVAVVVEMGGVFLCQCLSKLTVN